MSETTPHTHIDPVEEVLSIEAPTINDGASGAKKKFSPAKIGIGIIAASVVVLLGTQYLGTPPAKIKGPGSASVRVSEAASFTTTPSSAISTNSEASALAEKTAKIREAEVLKDPKKSYITADPFGDSSSSQLPMPPIPKVEMQQVQAPGPIVMSAPTQPQGEDPVVVFARLIFSQTTAQVSSGFTPANPSQVAVTGASGPGASTTGQTITMGIADIGAGEIKYATLTSGLNSRVLQTVPRAVIHGGLLDGAVLIGSMENVENHYLVLKFHALTINKRTYPIDAIAINPDLQDAGLADDVKSHLFERTALQAGVGFIQSFGAAKLQEGSSSSQSNGLAGNSMSTTNPIRTNKQTAIIALGGAAQTIQPAIDQTIADIKPEVIVKPGKEMGILFTKPLFLK
jgi:hypothetical protein